MFLVFVLTGQKKKIEAPTTKHSLYIISVVGHLQGMRLLCRDSNYKDSKKEKKKIHYILSEKNIEKYFKFYIYYFIISYI